MSEFDSGDSEGNPWLMTLIGAALLWLAWYLYSKTGVDSHMIGKAALANTSFGKKILIGIFSLLGAWFLGRGLWKIRNK